MNPLHAPWFLLAGTQRWPPPFKGVIYAAVTKKMPAFPSSKLRLKMDMKNNLHTAGGSNPLAI